MLDLGLETKKIAIISPDRYEWCCSYFAISTANCIVVPLDYLLPYVELTRLIVESQVDAIIFDEKYIDLMKDISKNKDSAVKHFICMDKGTTNKDSLNTNIVEIENLLYFSDLSGAHLSASALSFASALPPAEEGVRVSFPCPDWTGV